MQHVLEVLVASTAQSWTSRPMAPRVPMEPTVQAPAQKLQAVLEVPMQVLEVLMEPMVQARVDLELVVPKVPMEPMEQEVGLIMMELVVAMEPMV